MEELRTPNFLKENESVEEFRKKADREGNDLEKIEWAKKRLIDKQCDVICGGIKPWLDKANSELDEEALLDLWQYINANLK